MSPLERLSIYAAEQASPAPLCSAVSRIRNKFRVLLKASRNMLRSSLFASLRTVRWRGVQFSEQPAAARETRIIVAGVTLTSQPRQDETFDGARR